MPFRRKMGDDRGDVLDGPHLGPARRQAGTGHAPDEAAGIEGDGIGRVHMVISAAGMGGGRGSPPFGPARGRRSAGGAG